MTRQREPEARRPHARSADAGARDDSFELAQALIALHRTERAPRAVVRQVESRLAGWSKQSHRAVWLRHLAALLQQLAGWPMAGVVALLPLLLLTWQQQRVDAAHRQELEAAALQAAQRSQQLAGKELTLSGVAVPGSLKLVMYGDEIGMGHCEGSFSLELDGGDRGAPVRVRWTRCDLPDELSAELRRVFSPLRGAPPFPLSVRGHWTRAGEFEALGLQLQP